MSIDYKYYDFQMFEYLIRLKELWKGAEMLPEIKKWQKQVEQEQERIKTRKFRVAVVGEFRKGKSSFINALLGSEILPVDALPTTATINRITYGSAPKAFLRYKDGRIQDVPVGELSRYVTKLTAESQGYAAQIEEAVVEYPSIFCQNYVDLIDTPGMNDDDSMNQVTLGQLEQIDLAIVAISVSNPFSDTESRFVVQLLESEEICRIVIVVTKIDQARERERARLLEFLAGRIPEKVLEKLKERHEEGDPVFRKYEMLFSDLPIFGVCAPDALEARQYNDSELLNRSGFRELNDRLPQLILTSQNNSAVFKAVNTVRKITEEYPKSLEAIRVSIRKEKETIKRRRVEFARMCYTLAEKMLDDTRVKLFQKVNEFAEIKNAVRKDFITSLASVKLPKTEAIEQALAFQAARSAERIRRTVREELEPALYGGMREETQYRFRELLRILLTSLKEDSGRFPETQARLEEMIAESEPFPEVPEIIDFDWTQSPIPPAQYLQDKDMIIRVYQAVDHSVAKYCRGIKEKLAERLNASCKEAGRRLETVVVDLYRISEERIAWWDLQAKRLTGEEIIKKLSQIAQENQKLKNRLTEQFIEQEKNS